MKKLLLFLGLMVFVLGLASFGFAEVKCLPLTEVIKVSVGNVKDSGEIMLPLITWGGDIATILANGNSNATAKGSIFDQAGLKFKLARMDDFKSQVESFMRGDTPYLRGTMGMINSAVEALEKDTRTRPIVIYQMTWSDGGDCLTVKEGVTINNAKGMALQAYGPHIDYMAKILSDTKRPVNDVRIVWTKDLTGDGDTPMKVFCENKDVDAAFMIIPDGLKLTSNGKVGTGGEGSFKGAKIAMSTKTANMVIADVYAVRADYYESHKKEVQAFVHSLMVAEEQLKELFEKRETRKAEFKTMITASAKILLDSPQAVADVEDLYNGCKFAGFTGNVKFFCDKNWPRNFYTVADEIQTVFIGLGLLSKKVPLEHAKWDYNQLKAGLTGTESVSIPKFNTGEVAKVVEKKRVTGTLAEGELFSFKIFFTQNQSNFSPDMYEKDFEKVVNLASAYGGAIITVEGHSDPLGYLHRKKAGETQVVLTKTRQAAKNLSLSRALKVMESVIAYAKNKGITMDPTQFTVLGHGIEQSKTGMCGDDPCAPKTEEEWKSNMRVVFRIIQIEAEKSTFVPLD